MKKIQPDSIQDWRAFASTLVIDGRPFIGGRRNDAYSNHFFDVISPVDSKVLAALPRCGGVEIGAAVAAARAVADSGVWSGWPVSKRSDLIRKFAQTIDANAHELAVLDTLQMGMPISSALADIALATQKLREVAEDVVRLHGHFLPGSTDSLSINMRTPQGVVAAITPWNFPVFVALGKIGPALATGNCLVLKPSEIAPLACLRLADLAAEAGIPPGVFNVVPGLGAEAGHALASSRQVDLLSFTGSTATGRLLMHAAADSNLKALHLELGGKSPQIVLDDCGDLEQLAQSLADGFMFNSGQLCVAGSRLIIPKGLESDLVPLIARKTSSWRHGCPLDPSTTLGPLATAQQVSNVKRLIDRAHAGGLSSLATEFAGSPGLPAPIIFHDVPSDAEIAQEEVFGPVAACMSFESDAEALALANGTRYGLVATVWCSNPARGWNLAQRVRAGATTVNTTTRFQGAPVQGAALEPFGESGFGAEGGLAGLLAYTRARHLKLNMPC